MTDHDLERDQDSGGNTTDRRIAEPSSFPHACRHPRSTMLRPSGWLTPAEFLAARPRSKVTSASKRADEDFWDERDVNDAARVATAIMLGDALERPTCRSTRPEPTGSSSACPTPSGRTSWSSSGPRGSGGASGRPPKTREALAGPTATPCGRPRHLPGRATRGPGTPVSRCPSRTATIASVLPPTWTGCPPT